jgi:hypothetical protein
MVVFLASEQASYIVGQIFLVNGGAYFLDADACEPTRRGEGLIGPLESNVDLLDPGHKKAAPGIAPLLAAFSVAMKLFGTVSP